MLAYKLQHTIVVYCSIKIIGDVSLFLVRFRMSVAVFINSNKNKLFISTLGKQRTKLPLQHYLQLLVFLQSDCIFLHQIHLLHIATKCHKLSPEIDENWCWKYCGNRCSSDLKVFK